jgi:predicted DNA binding CopG/RHH family protein
MNAPLKPMPRLMSDEEAEEFVATADLSEYDLSDFKPVRFEFQPKDKAISLRLPQPLLDAVKERAKAAGVPYQRFIRLALEEALARKA